VNTGTSDPYVCLWGIKPTTYIKSKYAKPIITKQDLHTHFPNRFDRATRPKLILSGMRHFEAFYDEDGSCLPGKSTVVALPMEEKASGKFLLGLLNSVIPKVFFRECYGALAMDGGITFTNKNCGEIPIPKRIGNAQQRVERLVDRILAAKQRDPTADTSALEREIDGLVYALYGLTPEEIKIVEGAAK